MARFVPVYFISRKTKIALTAIYLVMATLAYGHSYSNNPYRLVNKRSSFVSLTAGYAAIVAPAYWLSVLGVWIFEADEEKIRPNPFGDK